jgi:DNA polymerase-3 subunit alpha
MFDEEFLKFRHYLAQNQFLHFKVNVREGWTNKETGKKSDPRLQFLEVKMLQDVLTSQAKKLTVNLNIKDLKSDLITHLSHLFQLNSGANPVSFDIVETEVVKKQIVQTVLAGDDEPDAMLDEGEQSDQPAMETNVQIPTEVEETVLVTKLSMSSKKLKVNICTELLVELEKLDVRFKLN